MEASVDTRRLSSAGKATYIAHLTEEVGGKTMSAGAFSVWFFLLFVVTLSIIIIKNGLSADAVYSSDANLVFTVLIYAFLIMMHVIFGVVCMGRRLNDIGVSPNKWFYILIPVVGYVYCLYLCFAEPHF